MRGQRSRHANERRRRRRPKPSNYNSSRSLRNSTPNSVDAFLDLLQDGNSFGDNPSVRDPLSTRLVFQNIDGASAFASSAKQKQLTDWWRKENIDIVLLAEMNQYWPLVGQEDQWAQRLRPLCRDGHSSVTAYNKHQDRKTSRSSLQYGGTSTSVFNEVAHRSESRGQDPWGLGRWSWI